MTRLRVEEAAERLHYIVSPSAASLASGRTRTIGLLTPSVNKWFFANAIDGAERALRAVGFDALLYTFNVDEDLRRPVVDPDVLRRRVDGVLVAGLPLSQEEAASLEALGVPLAFVGTGRDAHVTVRVDDDAVGRCAMAHLIGLGHRRVGHMTGVEDGDHFWSPTAVRRAAWAAALGEAGVVVEERWVAVGDYDLAGGRRAAHRLLDDDPTLTAFFAASDEMAMGAVLAARDRGLRIPEDLSIVGVDGHDLDELVQLTSVVQDPGAQGAAAARLLLGLIAAGQRWPHHGGPVLHPFRLVERGSTAPPRPY
jgi:LacI family transcriptional regulator, repressor for deo operon, udp, cdd, tsx, nupC, and nupG